MTTPIKTKQAQAAYSAGVRAHQNGFPLSYNQYHGKHKTEYNAWALGWEHSAARTLSNFMFGEE